MSIHATAPLLIALVICACGTTDSTSADAGASVADASSASEPDGASEAGVPVTASELFAFLQAGSYEDFDAEASVHPSAGPHGQVRSFFNSLLSSSLTTGQATHPTGSATVKELYTGGSLSGWAVMVKTGEGVTADEWYFYEVLSTSDGSNPVADGQGVGGCAGCHSGGVDFILTSFP